MFQFKQFSVEQDKTAMKVGTDGVLLGAWAPVDHDIFSILDIGAGTGLIALMLAQRTATQESNRECEIEAIEIDADAHEQAVGNFENSPWNDRLFCFHASLDAFMDELQDEEYDLIVSNPPFYSENVSSGKITRDIARQNQSLPFEDLLEAVGILLAEEGIFCTIIPFKEEQRFLTLARNEALFPMKITRIKGTPDSPIKRSLLAFSRTPLESEISELIIETSRHQYTQEYRGLTSEFYLDKDPV